ncbi:MAG: RHS repeat-associated core domain-containing protein [Anaerolineae bacterium]
MKKYYYAGAVRVAMRTGTSLGTVNYLLSDHLGSQALTLTSAGARLNTNTELRYMPYGAARYTAQTTPTTFNFTGQRKDSGSGLLFYNARWYDPVIGRFLAADTIVPQPGNPQSLNRYSYALNNPLGAVDRTGHWPEWVNNTFSYAMGAASQYLNNVSLGAFAALAVHGDLSLIENESYQQGRELGAMVSDAQAKFEIATGIGMAAAGTAAIAPTLGGGGVCALATAGVCALPAGGALVAEGAMVAGGGALAGHGTGVLLYAKSHPVERMTDLQKHGRPGSNVAQNKQFRGAVQSVEQDLGRKLTRDEVQELHEAVHELGNPGFDDIVNLAHDLFGGK